MHAFAVCVVPRSTTRADAEDAVRPMLAPFDEAEFADGWWDWWTVGGRWSGVYSEYDPTTDPANTEVCMVCRGTGQRPDMRHDADYQRGPMQGCNGCTGTGSAVKWPTQWVAVDDDVVPVPLVSRGPENTTLPLYLVLPDGRYLEKERWTGSEWDRVPDDVWRKQVLEALADYEDHALVVVDTHS